MKLTNDELKEIFCGDSESRTVRRFLTRDNVCQMFQVSRRTLHNWLNEGIFPMPFQVGGVNRWDMRDIESWYQEKKGGSS